MDTENAGQLEQMGGSEESNQPLSPLGGGWFVYLLSLEHLPRGEPVPGDVWGMGKGDSDVTMDFLHV